MKTIINKIEWIIEAINDNSLIKNGANDPEESWVKELETVIKMLRA